MERDRYRERVGSVMTLRLSSDEWCRVHRELAAAVAAIRNGDETALSESMTILRAYDGLRIRRRVNPYMGTADLLPIPEPVREVANELVHHLTPEPLDRLPQPTTRKTSEYDADAVDRY